MKRNPNATCRTCPIWHQNPKSTCGKCRLNPEAVEKLDTEWCGQHPQFWEAEEMHRADVPRLERIANANNGDDEIKRLRARVAELEAEVESSRRADVAINQALNEGDGSYRP